MKIAYYLNKEKFSRVLAPFSKVQNCEQLVFKKPIVNFDSLPTKDFYKHSQLIRGIKEFNPDVLATTSQRFLTTRLADRTPCVFLNHCILRSGDYFKDQALGCYNNFDLLFVATKQCKQTLLDLNILNEKKIITNALPQLDLLYDVVSNNDFYRNLICKLVDFNPNRIISVFQHNLYQRPDLNKIYYNSIIALANLAERNNWLILVKEKVENSFEYLSKLNAKNDDILNVFNSFNELKINKHVRFFSNVENPYLCFCADAIVVFNRYSVETEAHLAKKPLIVIENNKNKENLGELNEIKNSISYIISNENELENLVRHIFLNPESRNKLQEKFIDFLGVSFDGKHSERIISCFKNILHIN